MCAYTATGTEASDSGGVLWDKWYVLVKKTKRKKRLTLSLTAGIMFSQADKRFKSGLNLFVSNTEFQSFQAYSSHFEI